MVAHGKSLYSSVEVQRRARNSRKIDPVSNNQRFLRYLFVLFGDWLDSKNRFGCVPGCNRYVVYSDPIFDCYCRFFQKEGIEK